MNAGCLLMIIGAAIRIGAIWDYWWILAGNGVLAAGTTFLGGLPAKVSSFWFRVDWVLPTQRTNSTTIASVAMTLGGAIGMIIPTLFVGSNGSKDEVALLMIFEAALTGLICIASLVLMRNKPPTPPSATASTKREDFLPAFKSIMSNLYFLPLLVVSSLGLGVINIFSTVVEVVTDAYGFSSVMVTQSDAGIFGAVMIIAGLIGCFVGSPILAKTQKFKLMVLVCTLVGSAGSVLFSVTITVGNIFLSCFCVILLGFGMYPLYAFSIELGVELSYPVGEAMSTGLINCGGQIIGIAGTFATTALLPIPFAASFVMTGCMLLAFVVALTIRQRLVRSMKDHRTATMLAEELDPEGDHSINKAPAVDKQLDSE